MSLRIPLWQEDGARCQMCSASFTVLRRRHHCRLCGRLMCRECSEFRLLPFCSDELRVDVQCGRLPLQQMQEMAQHDTVPLLEAADVRLLFDALRKRRSLNPLVNDLNRLIRRGVPRCLKASVWPELLGVDKVDRPSFATLVQDARDNPPNTGALEADLERTYPEELRPAVRDVCLALTQLILPYQQGFSLIAAALLRCLGPEDTMWCMVCMLQNPRYGLGPLVYRGRRTWVEGFDKVFSAGLPRVSKALTDFGVDASVLVYKWLRSAYADVLPFDALAAVWDLFFLHGIDFLFRVAFAVFSTSQNRLLGAQRSPKEMVDLLNNLPRIAYQECGSVDVFIEACLGVAGGE